MDEEPGDAFVDPLQLVAEAFVEDLDVVDVAEVAADLLEQVGVLRRLKAEKMISELKLMGVYVLMISF